jgi:hypothetical protein
MHVVGDTEDALVLRDDTAHPRAFVVDRGATVDRAAQPDRTPAEIMTGPGFDPRANVQLEGAPPSERSETPASLTPVAVEDLGPNAVRISAHADGPSYLVVDDYYHRGWTTTVDGHSAPVYIANAMFRAVPLDPGDHTIEMRYTPITHLIGAAGSLLSLLVAAIVMARGFGPRFNLRRQ